MNYWWYQEREGDVVGLTSDTTLIAGECTFTSTPLGHDVLQQVIEDVSEIRWSSDGAHIDYEYALFSRGGFSESLEEAATERDDLRLFSVEDVLSVFR